MIPLEMIISHTQENGTGDDESTLALNTRAELSGPKQMLPMAPQNDVRLESPPKVSQNHTCIFGYFIKFLKKKDRIPLSPVNQNYRAGHKNN